ncbi:MAG: hypothetical protein J6Z80_01010 [Clostridia bacterium]|nr:hypothetical protein [Clostridia bacterium]
MRFRRLRIIISSLLSVAFIISAAVPCSAAALSDGVSILNPKQNIHGTGYEWDNPHDTLTLTNLRIDTDDDFGLKVPDGATVILNGVNRISAKVAALYIGGKVTIKGDGRLILDGGEYGVFCNSSDRRAKLSIISGRYAVTAGKSGFYSAVEKISLSGKAEIDVSGGSFSFETVSLEITNGATVRAVGQIKSSVSCLISAANVNVTAPDRAIISPSLVIERVSVDAGEGHDNEYVSQASLITVSEWKYVRTSVLFGESVPAYVDLLIALGAAAAAALAIILPILLRKRKLRKIEEAKKAG